MSANLENVNKILIIRLSSLGDILLTTPLIRTIKKKYPNTKIDYLLKAEYSDVIKNNPHINKIHFYKNEEIKILKKSLALENYDMIVDLQNNFRSREITSKLYSKKFRFKKYSFKKFLLVKTKINLMTNLPSIPQRYAATLGIELDNQGIEIHSDRSPNYKLAELKNIIGICPGAKHFTKRYPIEFQIKLCRMLIQNNFNVVLFGGKLDESICKEISSSVPQVINLQNNDDILQTVSDMRLCDTIICNDSGLMHAASSLNKKLIAIFGSTVKQFGFMPYNCDKSIIIENKNLSCRPCSHIGRSSCPKSHFKCMKELKPENIFELITKTNG